MNFNDAGPLNLLPQSLSPPRYLKTQNMNNLRDNLQQQQSSDKISILIHNNLKINLLYHRYHGSILLPKEPHSPRWKSTRIKAAGYQAPSLKQTTLLLKHASISDTTSSNVPIFFASPQIYFSEKTFPNSQNIPKSVTKKLNSNYIFDNNKQKGSTPSVSDTLKTYLNQTKEIKHVI